MHGKRMTVSSRIDGFQFIEQKGALLYMDDHVSVRSARPGPDFRKSGPFASLHSEQGAVSLVPLCGYPLIKAKGVTLKSHAFAYFTFL